MNICKALLKYGYSNFSISILEHCDYNNRLVREQYYIDTLQPEYNILKKAGSSVGYLHSEEAKKKISAANKGRIPTPEAIANFIALTSVRLSAPMTGKKHSEDTKKRMSIAKQGKNHPMFNKVRIEKVGSPSVKLEVQNIITNEIKIYESISEAAKDLGIRQSAISLYIKRKQNSPYKGRYLFLIQKIKSISSKGSSETSTQEI
jgi:group I intron endonuclease